VTPTPTRNKALCFRQAQKEARRPPSRNRAA
jgi:hypothetical protein